MKVSQFTATDKYDFRQGYRIEVETEGKQANVNFADGEPEDSNLARDFSGVYGIPELLKLAHEAGARGEDLTFEEHEVSWSELWER